MDKKKVGTAALALALARLALEVKQRRRAVRLRGATAIVCGASRGLGRSIALELARRGVTKIGICSRREHDLDSVAAALVKEGVSVCAESCDLSKREDVDRFIGSACARLGPIDVLVTNASTISVGPSAILSKEDFDEAMASIFYTALNPTFAVLPNMRRRGSGTIAMVTSIGGRIGVPHLAPYCAAKFATMGLAESLRAELAADGVHVLTVVPGLMRTGSHVHAQFKGDCEREYAWFGASATAPLISIDADRAARRIVSAIARGDVEVTFTPEARVAPLVREIAPNLFAETMALVARFLPRPPSAPPETLERREGLDIERTSELPAVQAVRERGNRIAERHAQIP
ncbi:MAG TPA: SDR family NAD(P)-dependent oxidoreductase [Labilithrix sp.]|nr:SDR family NAD(P)-dependent oxidoreductase [Labilithrix sp.]